MCNGEGIDGRPVSGGCVVCVMMERCGGGGGGRLCGGFTAQDISLLRIF